MPYLRRHLVPLLLMLPMVFVCGKLLLTPVNELEIIGYHERGWPWPFEHADAFRPAFSWVAFLADIGVIAAILLACGWLIFCIRRRWKWHQFSLRGLIGIVTVASLLCGWWMHHDRQSQYELALRQNFEGENRVVFLHQICAPQWLQCFVPNERLRSFERITTIAYYLPRTESVLPPDLLDAIPRLSHFRNLSVDSEIGDKSKDRSRIKFGNISSWRSLNSLRLDKYIADDASLEHLGELPRLKALYLHDCQISDIGFAHIGACKSLETLQIFGTTPSTARGINELRQLKNLHDLLLERIQIDDELMSSIVGLTSLQELCLDKVTMTDDLARRLSELPSLRAVAIDGTNLSDDTLRFLRNRIPEVEFSPALIDPDPSQTLPE